MRMGKAECGMRNDGIASLYLINKKKNNRVPMFSCLSTNIEYPVSSTQYQASNIEHPSSIVYQVSSTQYPVPSTKVIHD